MENQASLQFRIKTTLTFWREFMKFLAKTDDGATYFKQSKANINPPTPESQNPILIVFSNTIYIKLP